MQVLKALPPLSDLPKVLRDSVVSLVHDPDQLPEYPRLDAQSLCATKGTKMFQRLPCHSKQV